MYKLIKCKKAIFGNGKESKQNFSILIKNNIIEELGENESFDIPPNVEVFDLREYFVLPGLIDAHMHFFGVPSHQLHLLGTEKESRMIYMQYRYPRIY